MKKITFVLFALICSLGYAQTFTDAGGPYDLQNGNGVTTATCGTTDALTLPLAVTGVGTLGSTNSIASVTLNITHTWNADIEVSLQDPSGAITVILAADKGGSGDDYVNVVLQDGGAPLPTANTNLTGVYAPDEALAAFNAGTNADGTWNLLICDDANGDVGSLNDWSITFVPTPSCETPLGADVANVTAVSADFSWNDVAGATSGFEWGILAPGGDPDSDTFLFSGATAAGVLSDSRSGLTPETDYVFYVRSNCDGAGFSNWSGGFAFSTLAVPPINDNACDAIMLNIGDASSGAFYNNLNASIEAGEVGGSCYSFDTDASASVWFTFIASVTGEVLIQTEELAGNGTLNDTQITLYTVGDCSDLSTATEIACDDDDDDNVVGDGSGIQANLQVTGLNSGQTYYFVVDGFGTDEGTFDVSLSDPTLTVDQFINENTFFYFPNPVKNELTLKSQNIIQNVSVYNMLGQKVLRTAPNSINSKVDMNELAQGAYFVNVTINDITETVRIIKQ